MDHVCCLAFMMPEGQRDAFLLNPQCVYVSLLPVGKETTAHSHNYKPVLGQHAWLEKGYIKWTNKKLSVCEHLQDVRTVRVDRKWQWIAGGHESLGLCVCECFASAAPAGVRSGPGGHVSVTLQTGATSGPGSAPSPAKDGKLGSVAAIFAGLGS